MNAQDLIIELAARQLKKEIIGGHNGPYYDEETPIRNLSHWAITFSKCYGWTGDLKFKVGAEEIAAQLIQARYRPSEAAFYHRNKEGKDKSNGLVGQAWIFEALIEMSALFNEKSFNELVLDVFSQHTYDEHFGLWNILEIDGRMKEIDPTFNHQLWFAASLSPLMKSNAALNQRLLHFLDKIWGNLTVLRDGLIFHPIDRDLREAKSPSLISKGLKSFYLHPSQIKRRFVPDEYMSTLVSKSQGYHLFNLYALKHLKTYTSEHPIWDERAIKRAFLYPVRLSNINLKANKYAYGYNAPGFEAPFVIDNEDQFDLVKQFFKNQIDLTFDKESFSFCKNTTDSLTLTARIYELARTPEAVLKKLKF